MYKHPILWATWSWLAVSSTALWHMNIHQLDLNSDSFSGSSNLENRKWRNSAILAPKSSDQENREKTPIFETKAAVSFLMPQEALCLKYLSIRLLSLVCENRKINVYRSLLPSDRVIGWDMKMTNTSQNGPISERPKRKRPHSETAPTETAQLRNGPNRNGPGKPWLNGAHPETAPLGNGCAGHNQMGRFR